MQSIHSKRHAGLTWGVRRMVTIQARSQPLAVGPEDPHGQSLVPRRQVGLRLLANREGDVTHGLLLDPRGFRVLQRLLWVHQSLVFLRQILTHLEEENLLLVPFCWWKLRDREMNSISIHSHIIYIMWNTHEHIVKTMVCDLPDTNTRISSSLVYLQKSCWHWRQWISLFGFCLTSKRLAHKLPYGPLFSLVHTS